MLFFPLLCDLLLVDHDLVGTLLIALVSFLGLEEAVLKMSHLNIAFIVQLVDAAVEDDFESIHFRESTLFLVSKLVDKFTQPLVIVEIALVVSHI